MHEELTLGELLVPAKAEREKCERAQAYLQGPVDEDGEPFQPGWPLPSMVEEKTHAAIVWYIYKDTWPGDSSPDFKFSLALPKYVVWGRKKQEKYMKKRDEETIYLIDDGGTFEGTKQQYIDCFGSPGEPFEVALRDWCAEPWNDMVLTIKRPTNA